MAPNIFQKVLGMGLKNGTSFHNNYSILVLYKFPCKNESIPDRVLKDKRLKTLPIALYEKWHRNNNTWESVFEKLEKVLKFYLPDTSILFL